MAQVITWLLAFALAVPSGVAAAPNPAAPVAANCSLQLTGHGSKDKPGVLEASLNCTSKSGAPLPVGIDERYMKQHTGSFAGVQVLPKAKLPCQKQSTKVTALLYLCGNYSVTMRELSIKDVWLPPNKVTFNALMLLGQGVRLTIINSTITHNHAVASLYVGDTASLVLRHVRISGNHGRQSVAVRVQDKAHLVAVNSKFDRNNASESGGAISAHNSANLTLINCSVSHNRAGKSGGGMFAENESNVTLIDSEVNHNTAGNDSGAFYLSATMYLLRSQVLNNTVLDVEQGEAGVALMADNGVLYVFNGSLIAHNSAFYGGGVYAWSNCKVVVDNSTVASNVGRFGGFAYIRGFVKVIIRNNSTFFNNSAFNGACINAFASASVHITNSTFDLNKAMYGGAVFVQGTSGSVNVTSGRFTNNAASSGGGACYSGMSSRVNIGGVPNDAAVFVNNTAVQGGAFFARDYSTVSLLDGSVLVGNSAARDGGGVFAQESAGVTMRAGSSLSRNFAVYGGGLYLQGSSNATVGGLLTGNEASKDGGGLLTADAASLVLKNGAQFIDNVAKGMGGAMFLGTRHFSPSKVQQAIGSNNQAMFSPGIAVSTTNFTLLTDHVVTNFVSRLGAGAGIVHAELNVTGHFGLPSDGILVQAMLLNDATGDQTFLGSNRSNPDGIASLSVKVRKSPGVYIIRYSLVSDNDTGIPPVDVALHVRPCERGEVTPAPDACDVCPQSTYSLQPADTSCTACPPGADCPGSFAIVPLPGYWHSAAASIQLHRCPNQAACSGNKTALDQCNGTWTPQAGRCATYMDYSNLQCSTGYHGNLCGQCAAGYGTTKPFTCAQCLPKSTIIGLYMLAAICMPSLMKILCFFSIRENNDAHLKHTAEDSSLGEQPGQAGPVQGVSNTASGSGVALGKDTIQPSELLKPLVLFSQYLLIVSSLNIEWPSTLLYPFKALAWAWASSSPETLNIECLLSKESPMPVAAQKVLFYLLLPVVMLAALLLLDTVTVHVRRWLGKGASVVRLRNRLVPTCIVVFFFFFPSICRTTFSLFACTPIDQPVSYPHEARAMGSFWVLDVNQQCLQGYHRYFAFALGIPLVVICCVAIPAAIIALMLCNKHRLTDDHFMQYYGFLYKSYKSKCCWWEAVVALQTVVLVAISVFGYSLGPYYTALCMNSALALTGHMLAFMKPYAERMIGHVSLQCIGCLLLTSYFALTLLKVDIHSPGPAYGVAVGTLVLLVNVVFVLSVLWKLLSVINWGSFLDTFRGMSEKLVAGAAGMARKISRELSSSTLKDTDASPA